MTTPAPAHRVSAIPFPPRYDLPGKPEGAGASVQDAYRQTSFLLHRDLSLFEEGMNLQVAIVAASSGSKHRTHHLAAIQGLWSRVFLYLADGCLVVSRGSYPSALPLIRSACECLAAERQLHDAAMDEFLAWLEPSLRPSEAFRAVDIGLGSYFAGGALADDERLGAIYRAAGDLSRPNFGATLLQVGPESNNMRLALTFADAAFHFGWAQITLGWLLALAERQVDAVFRMPDVFEAGEETRSAAAGWGGRLEQLLAEPARARVETVEEDGFRRYLVQNFRRASSGAPKKFLL